MGGVFSECQAPQQIDLGCSQAQERAPGGGIRPAANDTSSRRGPMGNMDDSQLAKMWFRDDDSSDSGDLSADDKVKRPKKEKEQKLIVEEPENQIDLADYYESGSGDEDDDDDDDDDLEEEEEEEESEEEIDENQEDQGSKAIKGIGDEIATGDEEEIIDQEDDVEV